MDPDGSLDLVRSICRYSWPAIQAVRSSLFGHSETSMVAFFMNMLAEPLVFTRSQSAFHDALQGMGGIQPTPYLNNTPIVEYYGDPYPRLGRHRIDLKSFIHGLCQLLQDQLLLAGALTEIYEVPGRIVRAMLFHSDDDVTFPLRAFFFERFFSPNSPERLLWQKTSLSYVHTPEMIDLIFMDSVLREASPHALSEQAKNKLRLQLEQGDYATFDTMNGAVRRTMELTAPRCVMAFYSYFVHRMMAMPGVASSAARGIAVAQRYFELMFCMLMGYDVSDVLPLFGSIPLQDLSAVSEVAEEIRTFLRNPLSEGTQLLRAIYLRTAEFDRVWFANAQVRNTIVDHPESRRELTLFYVPCYDVNASELVVSLCEQQQVHQVRSLVPYLERIGRGRDTPYRMQNLLPRAHDPKTRDAVNRELYACNFGGGVHLHRVRWTIGHYARLVPMMSSLAEETYVGLDPSNHVFMIMPRQRMEELRLLMFVDAATMRNYRKPTAIYPLMLRLYMSVRGGDAGSGGPSLDQLSIMAVGSILGYWLSIPAIVSCPFSRVGMPRLNQPPGVLGHLHDVVALLYRQAVLREAPHHAEAPQNYRFVANTSAMGAVRSFLMSNAEHHMSVDNVELMERELGACDPEDRQMSWLRDALAVMRVLGGREDPIAIRTGRPGRPRRTPTTVPQHRLRTDTLATPKARQMLHRRDDTNPLVSCSDERTLTLVNLWMYIALLSDGVMSEEMRDSLLRDYDVTLAPLVDGFARNKYSTVSPDIVETWSLASDYLCSVPVAQYCDSKHELRAGCDNQAVMLYFILFLQQFEHLVCLPGKDLQRSPQVDVALVRWLCNIYSTPSLLMHVMPVSSYYDAGEQKHHAAQFETSMAIAEVLPSIAAQAAPISQTPTLCVHSYDQTQLSQTAIDLAMAFGGHFREEEAVNPALCRRVYSQIVGHVEAGKAK